MLFDTHCHLDAGNFPGGADEVLVRARSAGVGYFTVIGVGSLEQARGAVDLAERRDDVFATVGVHPHDAKTLDDALRQSFERCSVTGGCGRSAKSASTITTITRRATCRPRCFGA